MLSRWTTTKLITAGSLGVLTVILTLPASALVAISGIPLLGGFINIFLDRILDALALLIIGNFGTATLKKTILGIVALPTLLLGPPGFLPKILIYATNGLIIDTIYFSIKNKKIALFLSNGIAAIAIAFQVVYIGRVFNVPGIEQTAKIFLSPFLLIGAGLGGGISGLIGLLIYNKIKNSSLIIRIQK